MAAKLRHENFLANEKPREQAALALALLSGKLRL